MCTKHASDALKRERRTFSLSRHDLERWDSEQANNTLVEQRQKQARLFIVYEGVLQGHGTKKRSASCIRLATFENEREGQCHTNTAISDELGSENRFLEKVCLGNRDRASKLQGEARRCSVLRDSMCS